MMKRLHHHLLQLLLLTFLTATTAACAPLHLTPEQHQQYLERQQQAELAEQERQAHYASLIANAPFGSYIQCTLQNLVIVTHRGHVPTAPLAFNLLRSHTTELTPLPLNPQHGHVSQIYATFTNNNQIEICQFERFNAADTCAFAPTTINRLEQGQTTRLHAPRFLTGTLYCEIPRTQQPPTMRILN